MYMLQPKDYLDFMKERLDTIRVYRSVHGNMRYLQDHYTIRGLEHFVEMHEYLEMQRNQKEIVRSVIQAFRRNCSVESIRQVSLNYSAKSVQRAISRAAGAYVYTANTPKTHCTLSGAIHATNTIPYVGPRQPVDIPSLRAMNARLLQQVQCSKEATPRQNTLLTSADSTRRMLLQSALNVSFLGIHETKQR